MKTDKRNSFKNLIRTTGVLFILFVLGFFGYTVKELKAIKKKQREQDQAALSMQRKYQGVPLLKGMVFPPELQNVPLGEKDDIVVGVKKLFVRNVTAPYNASIIENGDNYLLFFRYDVINYRNPKAHPRIGCVELDKTLSQSRKEFVRIDTHSEYSEDPRVIKAGEEMFIIYNDIHSENHRRRAMYLANIDPDDLTVNYATRLDPRLKPVEKNWVPFAFLEEDHQFHVYFEYYLTPRKLFRVPDPTKDDLQLVNISELISQQNVYWPKVWGSPRGGTPARKVGNEYLSFFHSSFHDKEGLVWYVMGAYTFEDKPPFRVTGISHYPILFEGIYDSPPLNTARPTFRCIFPAGFAFENRDGRELIHLSCGENDSAIKIVTLDKEALLKSLKKL